MNKIRVSENKFIGENEPCFIIAETGINHNGDIKLACEMIDVAVECGVDAVKFQTFKAEEFVSDPYQTYTYNSQGKSITESMLAMFKRYEFKEQDWIEISEYCRKRNIIFFSTPQNPSDLDFLLNIVDLPVIKVGADDLTNLDLLKYYASKGKPIIISAGMSFLSELEDAVMAIKDVNDKLAVLHCISSYPAEAEEINMRKMLTIGQAFDVIIGFSDHTINSIASVMAVTVGAKIVEKHFTLDKNLPGPDHWFSSNPSEFKELVGNIRYAEKALGSREVIPTVKELEMREIARRSIVARTDILKGEIIKREHLELKRPGTGLPPKFVNYLIGHQTKTDIKKNELVTFEKI
ncbi:MAG: N-acetylneuraminate synthase family protein [Bacillota bacterium]|nr:N-acetylneuraminate synthase family protein [Bacillota bacterium]